MSYVRRLLLTLLPALLLIGGAASAQTYPNRPIKLIVPYPAGGSSDLIGRVVARGMAEDLGQQVVVEDIAGAGGRIGVEATSKGAPNGYTIGLATATTLGMAPVLYPKLAYNPLKSFVPISMVTDAPLLVVVNSKVPANTLQELIALAKAKPGTLNFMSVGPGSLHHFAAEQFKLLTGTDMVHVPYVGVAPAMVGLLANEVQVMFDVLASFQVDYFRTGELKALAVAGPKRIPQLPNVPTAAEAGVSGYEVTAWFGLVAPAGTPPEIVQRLNQSVKKALATQDVIDAAAKQGLNTRSSTSAEFTTDIVKEIDRWSKLVQATGFKLQ
jgi:tripartite-type tricarboxylate transporter receptor subunit TctC